MLRRQVDEQIERIEARLARERERVPPGLLHECVERAWARLADARVQTFVPILVERAVRSDLRTPAADEIVTWAESTADRLLAMELPRRWRHTQGVARRARHVAWVLPPEDRPILLAAAWLHDVGYARVLADTGFHPLDGARFLARQGVPLRVCALVAHHSGAAAVADQLGIADQLAEFEDERGAVRDALWYCDTTTSPDGDPVTVDERLAELRVRRGPDDPVVRALTIDGHERVSAVARTNCLLATQ